ncbi:MAG: PEP/pyruvate-binding domain-containing protein [Candidatus Cloacimonadales bacterium]|nr:PEP/pyruvate-binding domain-containing protein [Candidatus Cloacimonadales bacterium]
MLKDYKYRGNYLNFNVIQHFMKGDNLEDKTCLPGFLPMEVDYQLIDGRSGSLTLSCSESVYFSLMERSRKNSIMADIIAARFDTSTSQKLNSQIREFVSANKPRFDKMEFVENDFVVPSCTSRNYDIDVISHKGNHLLQLIQEGYPVPDFCILTSNTYLISRDERRENIKTAIRNLEKMTGQEFNSAEKPLIFAMRSAMSSYIPGLMPTFLNVGVTQKTFPALCRILGETAAKKIYLNSLQTIELNLFGKYEVEQNPESGNIDEQLEYLSKRIQKRDERLLHDALYQVYFFVKRAHEYFERNQDLIHTFVHEGEKYPAVIMHKMVWTVRDDESYPGVLYSRHARTGLGIQVESLRNIFGEAIMTGLIETDDHEFFDRESIKPGFPAVYHFEPLLWKLEKKLRSPVTVEFASESNGTAFIFAVLQLNASELTGRATLLSSTNLYKDGIIDSKRVIELIKPYHLTQIFSDRIDDRSYKTLKFFCRGVSILPRSAVTARMFFSSTRALEAKKHGEKIVICKESFVPSDTLVMGEVNAILSLTPAAIHVVTACRSYGVPAFLNLEKFGVKLNDKKLINEDGLVINEGDWVTISSKKQKIFIGIADYKPARFQHYLDGEKLEMTEKEERVFINMSRAFHIYDELVENLQLEQIVKLDELIKLVRSNLRKKPEKAAAFLNSWFDSNLKIYLEQILESELGTHQDQHKLYKMLSLERKIKLFSEIIPICVNRKIKGFAAGSFMLGRFLCLSHPVKFWNSFSEDIIARMLNEYILFEKYMNVLNLVGEREVNRARKKILDEGLGNLSLKTGNAMIFMTLKLSRKDLKKVKNFARQDVFDQETVLLIDLLLKPFGAFYNYDAGWSLANLEKLCEEASLPLPAASDI